MAALTRTQLETAETALYNRLVAIAQALQAAPNDRPLAEVGHVQIGALSAGYTLLCRIEDQQTRRTIP